MAKILTGDEILKAADRVTETVDVPEWGGAVIVRQMTASEKDQFDASIRDKDDQFIHANYRAKMCAACLCDEHGNLIFTPAQVTTLGKKSSVALTRIVRVAERLNGLSVEAVAAAKKDSGPEASDGSPTGSPSPAGSGT